MQAMLVLKMNRVILVGMRQELPILTQIPAVLELPAEARMSGDIRIIFFLIKSALIPMCLQILMDLVPKKY